jgi:hypothetical protein
MQTLTTRPTWAPVPWKEKAHRPPQGEARYICPHTGIRFYPIPTGPGETLAVPGVTSILSRTDSKESKDRLESWKQRQLKAGKDPDAGRKRGSIVHELLEGWIRGEPNLEHEEHPETGTPISYATGMEQHLEEYDSFLWSERPLVRGWEHCWSERDREGERIARVWSSIWGFAGVPDVIGRCGNINSLDDFKSSERPYVRCVGAPVADHQKTGYLKYKKTVKQLCAYKLAIEETLGIEIHRIRIIVGLPQTNNSQIFTVSPTEIAQETEAFKKACAEFWRAQASFVESEGMAVAA